MKELFGKIRIKFINNEFLLNWDENEARVTIMQIQTNARSTGQLLPWILAKVGFVLIFAFFY